MQDTIKFDILKEFKDVVIYERTEQIANLEHYTNEYIVVDNKTKDCVVIDPAFNGKCIYGWIKEQEYTLRAILITHCHADHTGGLLDLLKLSDVKVYIGKEDRVGLCDKVYSEEDKVGFCLDKLTSKDMQNVISIQNNEVISISDNVKFKVIYTPGHTSGSVTYKLNDLDILFVGDTVFRNSCGRTDLITSNRKQMRMSLDLLYDEYAEFYVCPGHGEQFVLSDSKRRVNLLFALGS